MTGTASDEALLAAVGAGDLSAMRTLYDRHAPWLAVRLARRCNDAEVVADVLEETFVAVWRKPASFHGDGVVAAWIWGIAIRRLVSRLRNRRPVTLRSDPLDRAPAPAAEEQVLLAVEFSDLGQAIAKLSAQMRAVVQSVVLDGLTTKEAARFLQVPESTVKTRLARAKVQLRLAVATTGQGRPAATGSGGSAPVL